MTLEEKIRFAYKSTFQCANGYSIEDCLKDVRGEKTNTICEILHYLSYDTLFNSHIVNSEYDVKTFIITYKFGSFKIIVKQFEWNSEYPFDTAETFAKWLDNQEKKILDTATLLTAK